MRAQRLLQDRGQHGPRAWHRSPVVCRGALLVNTIQRLYTLSVHTEVAVYTPYTAPHQSVAMHARLCVVIADQPLYASLSLSLNHAPFDLSLSLLFCSFFPLFIYLFIYSVMFDRNDLNVCSLLGTRLHHVLRTCTLFHARRLRLHRCREHQVLSVRSSLRRSRTFRRTRQSKEFFPPHPHRFWLSGFLSAFSRFFSLFLRQLFCHCPLCESSDCKPCRWEPWRPDCWNLTNVALDVRCDASSD